jgi:hypothetical protein
VSWFTPEILAPWETEIGKMVIQSHPNEIFFFQDPIFKLTGIKMDWRYGSSGRAPDL